MLRRCSHEPGYFPDSQFVEENGVVYHVVKGKRHRAERIPDRPPPGTTRLETVDRFTLPDDK